MQSSRCLNAAQNKKLPFQLSNQDEVGRGAGQRGGPSDTGCVWNTDQESFPHLHLILRLCSDLLRRPHVALLHPIRPFEVLRDIISLNYSFLPLMKCINYILI